MGHCRHTIHNLLNALAVAVVGILAFGNAIIGNPDQPLVLVVCVSPCAFRRCVPVVVEAVGQTVGAGEFIGACCVLTSKQACPVRA
jgi:hypothetical protein